MGGVVAFLKRLEAAVPDRLRPGWELARRTVEDTFDDRVPGLAAEAAFFALLSLFPMLLAVVGSIGYVADAFGATADVRGRLETLPAPFVSPETQQIYRQVIGSIFEESRGGIVSFGLLVALWGGSRAVNVYLRTVTIAYDLEPPRSRWQRRALAFGLTLAGTVLAVVVVPGLVLGPRLIGYVLPDLIPVAAPEWLVDSSFYLVMAVLVVAVLATFYHVAVPLRTRWRLDLPGAVLAMVLWLVGAAALRAYIAFTFRARDSFYGPFATPLVVLLWLYVTALAVLLGAELNAEIRRMWSSAAAPSGVDGRSADPSSGPRRSAP
ncbi:MAG TPA: YihY/virulence factor BrkB family protein [Nitriliruptorales bacterium]|nr:YihY/virulence factor BrkB family protein [Nitriliruptorales bacterium]